MSLIVLLKKIYHLPNKIVNSTKWYRNDFWGGALKFKNQGFNTKIVNLGSGVALHAFDYSQIPEKCANWALGPQSLVHDFNILRNYFSYLEEGAFVIIIICPFSCLKATYDKKHTFKYYPFLHPATIENFDNDERTRAYLTLQKPFYMMPWLCIKNTIKEYVHLLKNKVYTKRKQIDYEKEAMAIIQGWQNQFSIDNLDAPLSSKHALEQKQRRKLLDEMIEFCHDRNLSPIIVIPPVHPALRKHLSQNFQDNYIERFLNGIKSPVYNYLCDDNFVDNSLYLNPLFLSSKGAILFTNSIYEKITNNSNL